MELDTFFTFASGCLFGGFFVFFMALGQKSSSHSLPPKKESERDPADFWKPEGWTIND